MPLPYIGTVAPVGVAIGWDQQQRAFLCKNLPSPASNKYTCDLLSHCTLATIAHVGRPGMACILSMATPMGPALRSEFSIHVLYMSDIAVTRLDKRSLRTMTQAVQTFVTSIPNSVSK